MQEKTKFENCIELVLDEFKIFCESFLKIKNKQGRIVPFILNYPQLKVLEVIQDCLSKNIPIRLIILKARQEGISTLIEAFIFWFTYINNNVKSAVVGHVADASDNLFDMYKRFLDNLPASMKPEIKASNAKEVIFSKLGSEMKVLTAEGRGSLGRSDTFQVLHVTEVAFWSDAKATMTALLQSLSDTAHYFEESTANGVGGVFYDNWQSAKRGENNLIPIFLAWFDLPEYQIAFNTEGDKFQFLASLDSDEQLLIKTYNLSLEQLNWRRETIKFKCGGSTDTFKQEYPSNDTEAFLTSGRPIFDVSICQANYMAYDNFKPVRFDLVSHIDSRGLLTEVTKKDNPDGLYLMLEDIVIEDNDHYRFAVGTDVAEGLAQGDYSSMDVLDRKTMRFPIKMHGHIDPDELADEQIKLEVFLKKKAYFCTERNNHGLTTIINANKKGVRQFYNSTFQKGFEVATNELGFKTTSLTKPMIINQLNEAIREQSFTDKDKYFWDECLTFVRDPKGGMSAQGKSKDPSVKCYDDRIISKALAIHCHIWMPNYYNNYEKELRQRGMGQRQQGQTSNQITVGSF